MQIERERKDEAIEEDLLIFWGGKNEGIGKQKQIFEEDEEEERLRFESGFRGLRGVLLASANET